MQKKIKRTTAAVFISLFIMLVVNTAHLSPVQIHNTIGAQPNGGWMLPTNQLITPIGTLQKIEGARPKDMALSPDGKTLAVLTTESFAKTAVSFFSPTGAPKGSLISSLSAGSLGIAWTPDSQSVYISTESGKIVHAVRDGSDWKSESSFEASNGTGNPQVNGLAVSSDGKTLYAALGMLNSVSILELPEGKLRKILPVGIAPYHISLARDGRNLYVSCMGGRIPAVDEKSVQTSAGTSVRVDSKTDATLHGSISAIDTRSHVVRDVEVGSQPLGMAITADGKTLYAAISNEDSLSVIDAIHLKVRKTISLRPADNPGFGQMPTSLTLSDDEKTLFASLGGSNSIAVVNVSKALNIKGYIPAAWFPIAVTQKAGILMVASSKGIGPRPESKTNNHWYVHDSVGTVQFIPASLIKDLKSNTHKVALNNRWGQDLPARAGTAPVPIPERVGEASLFKHVVYIIKENQTYDSILGDMPEGNGDKSLNLFGEKITPNQHSLARQFVLLDNTFTSGTNSADGHQWCVQSAANAYLEQNYKAHIRSYPFDGGDSLATNSSGYLWSAVAKKGLTPRVYGEFVNKPQVTGGKLIWSNLWQDYKSGSNQYTITAHTDNATLRPYLHPNYIGWPTQVSDQWRCDQFLTDLATFEKRNRMPDLCILILPTDHTSGTDPGMPTPRACQADNDLALGRIVEGISHSQFWKDTLILVVEDDSQAAVDHVDGHRMPAQCISAYSRRDAVVSELYNHTSVIRTIELALGIPAMNRFDRTATSMKDCFTLTPDLKPYTHIDANIALSELNPAVSALRGESRRLAHACAQLDWSGLDRADPLIVARANWHSLKPNTPFPERYITQFAFKKDDDD